MAAWTINEMQGRRYDDSGPCHEREPDMTAPHDEQTETDKLDKILTSNGGVCGHEYVHYLHGDKAPIKAAIEAWSRQQTARVLQRLHRTDGEGLPKRDYDNVTDEAIDAELAALRVGLNRATLTPEEEA